MLFIGPEAERRFGHRHFMGLMAVFTAPPEFTVLQGRNEIGRVDPVLLADWVEGPRDRCSAAIAGGSPGPTGNAVAASSSRLNWRPCPLAHQYARRYDELARAMRDVLLGADPPVTLTRRAAGVRLACGQTLSAGGRAGPSSAAADNDLRWWTWAGYRANATLKATLGGLADESQRVDDLSIRLRTDLRPQTWSQR